MTLLLFVLINAFAGFFQGIVGFGQGLIASPLSLTILDKGTVLTALMMAGLVLNAILTRKVAEPLDKKVAVPLLVGSLLGMPFGVMVLKILPIDVLKVVVGSLSIVLTLATLFVKIRIHHMARLTPAVGFLCGVLQTSTGMPGPPAVLLLAGSNTPKNSMRKILFWFFFWTSLVSLPLYAVTGVLTVRGLIFGLCIVPFVIVAGHYGNRAADLIPQRWYRTLALGTVSLAGLFVIYSGLSA